ncbi:MAG: hypothetical protein D6741_02570 [Planctomycetota bacterium]|nr:MAG: hypothetical protein D6741_02570 [Planctomycetota bacterium]
MTKGNENETDEPRFGCGTGPFDRRLDCAAIVGRTEMPPRAAKPIISHPGDRDNVRAGIGDGVKAQLNNVAL